MQQLPAFLRRANTTFLNLRGALDDLEPLVDDSKPVAKKLRPFLAELRPLAQDARPTFADLSHLLQEPGKGNDLVDLTNGQVPLRDVAVRDVNENGKDRDGAFPASAQALKDATPEIAFLRPYTVDLLGWFDDFSHSGTYDALGAASRVGIHASAFSVLDGQLTPVPPGCATRPSRPPPRPTSATAARAAATTRRRTARGPGSRRRTTTATRPRRCRGSSACAASSSSSSCSAPAPLRPSPPRRARTTRTARTTRSSSTTRSGSSTGPT